MKHENGEKVRNHQDTKNDSQEQRDKVNRGQDIEPQAENWNPRDLEGAKEQTEKAEKSSKS